MRTSWSVSMANRDPSGRNVASFTPAGASATFSSGFDSVRLTWGRPGKSQGAGRR